MMSRPGIKSASLDSSVNGSTLEASRPDGLSMPEKHELVYEIAKGSEGGPEILQSWKRKELLHILCAEMGKERKYTGLPKCKMIEHLLKIVALKKSRPQETERISLVSSNPANAPTGLFRRQRKREHPLRLPEATALPLCANEIDINMTQVCKNCACRAVLSLEDRFCKRCSCCICHQFDDNKDPSVWLVCSSESPSEGVSCGLSCHLECALKHVKSGIVKVGQHMQLDGSYCCPSCGRVSGLMGCWKKQLTIAKEARRVDILCYRISLAQRLLNGTEQFKEPHDIVLRAARKLEEEVGPINGVSSKMARGIVSRLSTGLEVQKLCALAIEKAEALVSMVSSPEKDLSLRAKNSFSFSVACRIQFEDISPTSLVVLLKEIDPKSSQDVIGYKLWHRTSRELSYPKEISCVLPRTQTRALISNLQPCTEYAFKIVSYTNRGDLGHSEAKCFTKSVEIFRRNIGSSMTKRALKKPGNMSMEDFSSTSAKGELESQPNEGFSGFKVRDLGKIVRAAWAQEHESNAKIDCTDKNMPINQFNCCEKAEACDSDKPFVSSDGELNIVSTSPLEVSRHAQIDCNLIPVAEPEDAQAESFSALNEEPVMAGAGMGPVKMSNARRRSQKDSSKLSNHSQATKLSKKDHENQSKVTISKKMPSKRKCNLLARSDMVVVPLDCSYPVFPVDTCKLDLPKAGILRNGLSHSNGSDSENWAVQPIREVPAVDSKNDVSRKRTLNTYGDLHDCDGALQNGHHISGCLEKNYEDSVKIIRGLERRGHIEQEFRKKFLTWFSLRATAEQREMVYVFIDNFLDDPASLAEQLVDTFLEMVSNKRLQVLPNGFCTKLWH